MSKFEKITAKCLSIINIILLFFMCGFILYSYHMQMNGNQVERTECWKQGGLLWTSLSQELTCIIPPQPVK